MLLMERRGIKKAINEIIVSDVPRFALDLVRDITKEVSIPEKVESWARENISESEIEKIADEIMKDPKLREKWMDEYEMCMMLFRSHRYCVSVASSSVVRDYFSSEEGREKLLDWVKRYLKEKINTLAYMK